jgi:hypothetical protein
MKLKYIPRDLLRALRIAAKPAMLRHSTIRPGKPHTLPGKLVVSLTSYPPRFPALDLTLRCLMSQDMAPDAIILWVAHGDADKLPRRVRELEAHGLTIRTCDDTGSFKKVVPACLEFSGAFLLLCDDDVAYPATWLRRFVEHWRYPDEVLCQWGRRLTIDGRGRPLPWWSWPPVLDDHPHWSVMPIGCGGVLYPPGTIPASVARPETFTRLCPNGDDIWLFWHLPETGATARCIQPEKKFRFWGGTQDMALWKSNDYRGGNDRKIAAMFREFGLPHRIVFDDQILEGLAKHLLAPLVAEQRRRLAALIEGRG